MFIVATDTTPNRCTVHYVSASFEECGDNCPDDTAQIMPLTDDSDTPAVGQRIHHADGVAWVAK